MKCGVRGDGIWIEERSVGDLEELAWD